LLPYVRTSSGARLNFAVVLSDVERLFNTGLFEDVNFRLEPAGSDSVILIYELTERPFGFYSLGIRYDFYDNVVVGAEVGEENILGSGATVRAAGVVGNPNEFRLGITGTRIFNLLFGYRVDGYVTSLSRSFYQQGQFSSSYFVRFLGGIAEAGYITGGHGFFKFGVRAERVSYEGAAVDTIGSQWLAGGLFNLEFNNQDRLDLPASGLTYRLSGFYSSPKVLSQQEFFRLEFNGEQLVPIASRLALRFWSEIGVSFGQLPLSERFLSGGERFAGFAEQEFVSDQRLIFGTGLRFRAFNLLNRNDYPLFVEALGNIGTFTRPDILFKSGKIADSLHWGVGAGVMTATPIGPLRMMVSLGNFFKPVPHPGGVRFYLSLGNEFRYRR
jgi:outer membrane protein assembly factor BamA